MLSQKKAVEHLLIDWPWAVVFRRTACSGPVTFSKSNTPLPGTIRNLSWLWSGSLTLSAILSKWTNKNKESLYVYLWKYYIKCTLYQVLCILQNLQVTIECKYIPERCKKFLLTFLMEYSELIIDTMDMITMARA